MLTLSVTPLVPGAAASAQSPPPTAHLPQLNLNHCPVSSPANQVEAVLAGITEDMITQWPFSSSKISLLNPQSALMNCPRRTRDSGIKPNGLIGEIGQAKRFWIRKRARRLPSSSVHFTQVRGQ